MSSRDGAGATPRGVARTRARATCGEARAGFMPGPHVTLLATIHVRSKVTSHMALVPVHTEGHAVRHAGGTMSANRGVGALSGPAAQPGAAADAR